MKFWRIFAAAAVVGMLIPGNVAFADDDDDDDDSTGTGDCYFESSLTLVDGLTVCPGLRDDTSTGVGNGFPWENSTGIFATFRNMYLFPSALIGSTSVYASSIETVHARSVSFTGASTNVYGSFPNGDDSYIQLGGSLGASLSATFDLNQNGYVHCQVNGDNTNPITIDTSTSGPGGKVRSQCASCVDPAGWCSVGDISAGLDSSFGGGALWDHYLSVYSSGNSGAGVWDTSNGSASCGGAADPSRAYGSGAFANPNHMTTALGVDGYDFVWIFKGLAPPPPATVQQQVEEIIRLLLTPEGLRCSGLDLTVNGKPNDDPVAFPAGATVDPIQPTVGTGGIKGGTENFDGPRDKQWKP